MMPPERNPTRPDPALLATIHDVSPLTLDACRQAARLLNDAAGILPSQLTVLAIPFHEGRVRLDRDAETVRWLRELADAGATVVLHGLTHRMQRPIKNPLRWFWGYGFARGQGELWSADAADAAERISRGREIVTSAGLPEAARSFIPPAWLLSSGARRAVDAAGFDWVELLDGIHLGTVTHARGLVGWGSLNAVEAVATTAFAAVRRARPRTDLRLCVHPADLRRPLVRNSIAKTVRRLRAGMIPLSYREYLGRRA